MQPTLGAIPTTQPALTVAPATQPVARNPVVAQIQPRACEISVAPTTQPTLSAIPTTQPALTVVPATQPVALNPGVSRTQPRASAGAVAPATQPTRSAIPTTQPALSLDWETRWQTRMYQIPAGAELIPDFSLSPGLTPAWSGVLGGAEGAALEAAVSEPTR
jgi:hypothetical protein